MCKAIIQDAVFDFSIGRLLPKEMLSQGKLMNLVSTNKLF